MPTVGTGQAPARPEECLNPPRGLFKGRAPGPSKSTSPLAAVRPLINSSTQSFKAVVLCFTASPVTTFPHPPAAAAEDQWEF